MLKGHFFMNLVLFSALKIGERVLAGILHREAVFSFLASGDGT